MRRCVQLLVGILIGQWLAFGSQPSVADFYTPGIAAWEHGRYSEALVYWSRAAMLQPNDPVLQYRRGTALARLGFAHAAADAYRLALLLDPTPALAALAEEGLRSLTGGVRTPVETVVPVEPARGVWVASVVLNGERTARFLVDTGSSVTLVSPSLADALKLREATGGETIELQTLAGPTIGPVVNVASLRVGDSELRDVSVVVHDPGLGVDGILGNSVLGRYRLTLDADRRLLHLNVSATK